jgi:GAF domain-containing protein
MSENLIISGNTKEELYNTLLPQLIGLTAGENDLTANLANIVGAIKQTFNFLWVGVYIVKGNELVLGPFQGPVACTRIKLGKGVCGASWEKKQILLVPDVALFPGHISCNSEAKSEIVAPAFDENENVILVIDIDSNKLNDFDAVDRRYLKDVATLVSSLYKRHDA